MDWINPAPSTNPPMVNGLSVYGMPPRGGMSALSIPAPDTRVPAPSGIFPWDNSAPVSAALLGAVIGGANAFGRNLYRVQKGEMNLSQAMGRSLMHGAATSLATTAAAVLAPSITDSDAVHLIALTATAAGLSYLICAGAHAAYKTRGTDASDLPI